MKTTAFVAALLASVAMAQPHHGRHAHQKKDLDKRKYETEWVTETKWFTLLIDENGTTLQGPSPAQFYPSTTSEETTSTTSTSTSESTSEPSSSTTPEPTSVQPEPTTYSTPEAATVESEPTTTNQAPVYTPTTAETAQPTSGSDSGSSGGGSGYTGDITFYDLVGPGACGSNLVGMTPSGTSTSDLAVVAVSHLRFTDGVNPNFDPVCGKIVKFIVGGKTGYGRVLDKCMGCAHDDLDINPEAFKSVALADAGRLKMSWEFLS